MRNSRLAACLVSCLLACMTAQARDWTPMSRERALEQTRSAQPDERRLAYGRLAEIGTMDDVPVLLAALSDEDALIRGVAEQSVWGIWMRTDDPVADPLFQTGMQMITEDEPRKAVEKFDQVIELKPGFAEVWNRRGNAWEALGEEELALADYRRSLELNPYEFGAMQSIADILMSRGEYRKAAEYFRQALEINPNLTEVAEILQALEQKLENDRI
ncbi:MAG TPA: tetratricopeptide repeat protein [Burkholderiales bacterium]|nr:tetratricopeptide repeat protein [Burkholderiales bacterium]